MSPTLKLSILIGPLCMVFTLIASLCLLLTWRFYPDSAASSTGPSDLTVVDFVTPTAVIPPQGAKRVYLPLVQR